MWGWSLRVATLKEGTDCWAVVGFTVRNVINCNCNLTICKKKKTLLVILKTVYKQIIGQLKNSLTG